MTGRFHFIINPTSGSAKKHLPEALRLRFPGSKITFTERSGHATLIAQSAIEKGLIPVACGGDGTFREVALGTAGKGPMGFIPLGTVNLLGKNLGIPSKIETALDILEAGRKGTIYPAVFETEREKGLFFIGISAGPDADAVHSLNPKLKKRIGRYAYVWSLIRRLAKPVFPFIECEDDGAKKLLSYFIALRMPYYGGPFRLGKSASLFNRELEIIGVYGGRISLLALYASVLSCGLFPEPKILRKTVHSIVVKAPGGRFQVDGDTLKAETLTLSTSFSPLEVICRV